MEDPNYPSAGAPAAAEQEPDTQDKDENQESESALLPKSLVGADAAVGQTITLKVVGIYEDEVEVSKVEGEEESSSMESAESELDAMAGQE